jgi:glycosyltransferase involved in cell wall biosynthesis
MNQQAIGQKFLHVLPSLDPQGGGPAEGVKQYGMEMLRRGSTIEVVTLDEPSSPFIADFPLRVHALGPSVGFYRYNKRLVPWLKAHRHEYQAVFVNGLWQYSAFGVWRALRSSDTPYHVFTHGMLDPWFKQAYPLKHLKKWLYWPWADYRLLRDAQSVLFTSEEERLLARQSFWLYRARERVVAYGTTPPPPQAAQLREQFLAKHENLRDQRLLLFLGRIHVKKGCDLLIEAFAKVAGEDPLLQLVMVGPDQTGWVDELKAMAQARGIAHRVHWLGMLRGDMKWGAMYSAEAFVLPSHQENFGIAVAEALACGLPVLISDKVNIWREVLDDGGGLVGTDSLAGTEKNLRDWLSMNHEQRLKMRARAIASFQKRFTVQAMATSMMNVTNDPAAPAYSRFPVASSQES